MKFAYADPPYLGSAKRYKGTHPNYLIWDDPTTHQQLITYLEDSYPDGWLLSAGSNNLITLLPMFRTPPRTGAWVKSFAAFKVNVNPAYTWEPVFFRGGRKRDRVHPTVKDHIIEPIALKKGLVGAKPARVCKWLIELMGANTEDTFDDLFPGTGIFTAVWQRYREVNASVPPPR